MNIRTIFLTLFGLQAIATLGVAEGRNLRRVKPGTTIENPQALKIADAINQARRQVSPTAKDMLRVEWDFNLENALQDFVTNTDPEWFFETVNLPGPKLQGNSSYNGFHLMEFEPFKTKFPGYGFLIHDTTRAYANNVLKIINFRLRQSHCIDFTKCSTTSFSNFESCGSPLVSVPSQPCSWATQYLPRMTISSLTKLSCVLFNVHGPNAPKAQDWSFWCYGKFKQPENDRPFNFGKPCSDCPPETSQCVEKLCMV